MCSTHRMLRVREVYIIFTYLYITPQRKVRWVTYKCTDGDCADRAKQSRVLKNRTLRFWIKTFDCEFKVGLSNLNLRQLVEIFEEENSKK